MAEQVRTDSHLSSRSDWERLRCWAPCVAVCAASVTSYGVCSAASMPKSWNFGGVLRCCGDDSFSARPARSAGF